MIGYAQTDLFTAEEIELFRHAERLVASLPFEMLETPLGVIRCHELARAVADVLNGQRWGKIPVIVQDGKFALVEHSWIELPSRNILDVYAVGSFPQVQLVHMGDGGLRERNRCYQPSVRGRDDIRTDTCRALAKHFAVEGGRAGWREEMDRMVHQLWTRAVGTPGYIKADWMALSTFVWTACQKLVASRGRPRWGTVPRPAHG